MLSLQPYLWFLLKLRLIIPTENDQGQLHLHDATAKDRAIQEAEILVAEAGIFLEVPLAYLNKNWVCTLITARLQFFLSIKIFLDQDIIWAHILKKHMYIFVATWICKQHSTLSNENGKNVHACNVQKRQLGFYHPRQTLPSCGCDDRRVNRSYKNVSAFRCSYN